MEKEKGFSLVKRAVKSRIGKDIPKIALENMPRQWC